MTRDVTELVPMYLLDNERARTEELTRFLQNAWAEVDRTRALLAKAEMRLAELEEKA